MLLSRAAGFDLAEQVRSRDGAPLGDVFAFLSGLYFRGKLAYAQAFARAPRRLKPGGPSRRDSTSVGQGFPPPRGVESPALRRDLAVVPPDRGTKAGSPARPGGVFIITPSRGLQAPDFAVTARMLEEFARVQIEAANAAYRQPLEASARLLAGVAGRAEVVLLGSIATGKYVDVLLDVFGARLLFPADFVGRGDMSRGGLMLRCARAGQELACVPVRGAVRHGQRPPKLEPLRHR